MIDNSLGVMEWGVAETAVFPIKRSDKKDALPPPPLLRTMHAPSRHTAQTSLTPYTGHGCKTVIFLA